MAEEYSYTESVQIACSNIYWSCDCFLFLFIFPMAYVPKHPTTQKSAWLLSCTTPVKNGRSCMRKTCFKIIMYFVDRNTLSHSAPAKMPDILGSFPVFIPRIQCQFHVKLIAWSKLALFQDANWTRWPPKVLCNQSYCVLKATVQHDFLQVVKNGKKKRCLGFNSRVWWQAVTCWSKFTQCSIM